MREFNQTAKNCDLVYEEDLLQLKNMRDSTIQQNSKAGKFQNKFDSGFKAYVEQINSEISLLEKFDSID